MLFSKCSILEEIKGQAVISNKQNFENEGFQMRFTLLKIKK